MRERPSHRPVIAAHILRGGAIALDEAIMVEEWQAGADHTFDIGTSKPDVSQLALAHPVELTPGCCGPAPTIEPGVEPVRRCTHAACEGKEQCREPEQRSGFRVANCL
jgi:hypothetical protein